MATRQKLGIDVEINYPTANQIAQAIKTEWSKVKETDKGKIKLWVEPDLNSLARLKTKVQKALNEMDTLVKFKSNIEDPLRDLRNLSREFNELKSNMERGLTIDLNISDTVKLKDSLEGIVDNGKIATNTLGNIGDATKKMGDGADLSNQEFDKIVTTFKYLADGEKQVTTQTNDTINSFEKLVTTTKDGQTTMNKFTLDRVAALKQIVSVQKEINGLSEKQVGAKNADDIKAYQGRVEQLSSYLFQSTHSCRVRRRV